MLWILVTTIAVLSIIAAQVALSPRTRMDELEGVAESFMNYIGTPEQSGIAEPDLADFKQGLPLEDFLRVDAGLNRMTAAECADADGARVTEAGGSYLQRTNNFRHQYPDYCMTRPDDFVAAVYAPRTTGLGKGVGCAGLC